MTTTFDPRLNCFRGRLIATTVAGAIAGYVPACTSAGESPVPELGSVKHALSGDESLAASLLTINVSMGADSHCAPSARTDIPQVTGITAHYTTTPNVDDLAHSSEVLHLNGWIGNNSWISCNYFRNGDIPGHPYDGWHRGPGNPLPGEPPSMVIGVSATCAVAVPFMPTETIAWDMLASYVHGPDLVACTPDQPAMPDCDTEEECSGNGPGGSPGGGLGDPGPGPGGSPGGDPGGGGSPGGGGIGGGGLPGDLARTNQSLDYLQGALIDFDFTDDEVVALANEAGKGDPLMTQRLVDTMRLVVERNRKQRANPEYAAAARARNQAMAARKADDVMPRGPDTVTTIPAATSEALARTAADDTTTAGPDPANATAGTSELLPPVLACIACGGAILVAIGGLLIAIGDSAYLPHVKGDDARAAKLTAVIGAWLVALGSLAALVLCYECPPFMTALVYVATLVAKLTIIYILVLVCIAWAIFFRPAQCPRR